MKQTFFKLNVLLLAGLFTLGTADIFAARKDMAPESIISKKVRKILTEIRSVQENISGDYKAGIVVPKYRLATLKKQIGKIFVVWPKKIRNKDKKKLLEVNEDYLIMQDEKSGVKVIYPYTGLTDVLKSLGLRKTFLKQNKVTLKNTPSGINKKSYKKFIRLSERIFEVGKKINYLCEKMEKNRYNIQNPVKKGRKIIYTKVGLKRELFPARNMLLKETLKQLSLIKDLLALNTQDVALDATLVAALTEYKKVSAKGLKWIGWAEYFEYTNSKNKIFSEDNAYLDLATYLDPDSKAETLKQIPSSVSANFGSWGGRSTKAI